MQYINGIPLIWDVEADKKLLVRVFTAGLPAAPKPAGYGGAETFEGIMDDNPFGKKSIFYTPVIMDDKDGTFEAVGDFPLLAIGFASIGQLSSFLLDNGPSEKGKTFSTLLKEKPVRIVCAYLKNTTIANAENLVFAVVGDVLEHINSTTIAGYTKQMLPILSAAGEFAFTEPQVKQAFEHAMPYTFKDLSIAKKVSTEQSQLYKSNLEKLNALVEDTQDPATRAAILLLCQTLLESNIDVLQTYNQQTDVRYDAAYPKRKLTVTDILYMTRRIRKLQEVVTEFQKGDFRNGQQITDFVNSHFVDPSALGTATRYIIKYPFENLGYAIRKKMVLFLLFECEFALSEFYDSTQHMAEKVSHWDVLYNLLTTGSTADRLWLLSEMEENDLVFNLLYYAKNDEFLFNISIELSNLLLSNSGFDEDEKKAELIKQGNYMYFSMELAKKQKEELVLDEASILLENKGFWNFGKYLLPKEEADYDDKVLEQYLEKYASPTTLFKPLDLIVLFAEKDINAGFIKLAAGESVVLPACVVYLLFRIDTNRAKDFITALTTTLIFLPFGVSGLIGAIRAANSLGIIVSAVDITVDAAYLTYTSPSIQNSDLREDLEFINTLAAIYGLARLSYSLGSSIKNVKGKQLLKDIKTAIDSLKKEGKLLVGTGGGFKYLKETESARILCQEQRMSCAAACIRQLAKDNGIEQTEAVIREWAKTDLHEGTILGNIGPAMQKVFEGKTIQAGSADLPGASFEQILKILCKEEKPWIASIKPSGKMPHTVIVDKIRNGRVVIRDPWNKVKGFGDKFGVEAELKISDFVEHWKGTRFHFARIIQ